MGKQFMLAAALLATGLGIGACSDDPVEPGSMSVSWSIGGTTCSAAQADTVLVSIFRDDVLIDEQVGACDDGALVLSNVAAGSYLVLARGRKANSELASFIGSDTSVTVSEGTQTTVPKITMAAAPGAIDLGWSFPEGKLCSFAGVESVTITIFDDNAQGAHDSTIGCNPEISKATPAPGSEYLSEAVGVIIPDLFAGTYNVTILAHAEEGDAAALYFGKASLSVTPSALLTKLIPLAACTDATKTDCE